MHSGSKPAGVAETPTDGSANSDVSLSCPRCGTVETGPRGSRRHCARCNSTFTPVRRSFPRVIYTAFYDQSFNCTATVIYPDAVAGGKRSAPLDPRLDLWNHSPSGVGYGYAGSGPAQLALGILADFLGPGREDLAVKLHQSFKFERIATAINAEPLVIPGEDISAWLRDSAAGKRALAAWYAEFPNEVLSFGT